MPKNMTTPSKKESESSPLAIAFAAEIRASMGRHRLSGNQLATATGMSQNYIAKRLRDEAPFTLDDIAKICAALGVNFLDLAANANSHLEPQPTPATAGAESTAA